MSKKPIVKKGQKVASQNIKDMITTSNRRQALRSGEIAETTKMSEQDNPTERVEITPDEDTVVSVCLSSDNAPDEPPGDIVTIDPSVDNVSENISKENDFGNPSSSKLILDAMAEMMKDLQIYIQGQLEIFSTALSDNATQTKDAIEGLNRAETNYDKINQSLEGLTNDMKDIVTRQLGVEKDVSAIHIEVSDVKEKLVINDETHSEMVKSIEYNAEEITALKKEIEELKKDRQSSGELLKLKKEYEQYKESCEQRERKMNLWFYDLEDAEDESDTWLVVSDFAERVLGLENDYLSNVAIKNAHRVGQKDNPKRPIIVAFSSWNDRQKIMRKSSGLYAYNQEYNKKYGVRTDYAPLARQRRNVYRGAQKEMIKDTGLLVRTCDNEKGFIWLESRPNAKVRWQTVKEPDPKYFPPNYFD